MFFEVFQSDKSEKWYFRCKFDEDNQILRSEAFDTKSACLKGIESVKKFAYDVRNFSLSMTKDKRPYFNVQSPNGEILATSVFFQKKPVMKNMIAAIRRDAKNAKIKEL